MPKITAKLDHEPLFSDEDPLTITIPGVCDDLRLSDFNVNPPVEDDVNPERTPLVYMVEYISSLAWETPEDVASGHTPNRDKLAQQLADALRDNSLTVGDLGDIMGDISEAQATAIRARASRASGRPTQRRRR